MMVCLVLARSAKGMQKVLAAFLSIFKAAPGHVRTSLCHAGSPRIVCLASAMCLRMLNWLSKEAANSIEARGDYLRVVDGYERPRESCGVPGWREGMVFNLPVRAFNKDARTCSEKNKAYRGLCNPRGDCCGGSSPAQRWLQIHL